MDSTTTHQRNLAVITSGGDAPGMNAAVRAVVRSARNRNVEVFAIYEGYQGLVDGGELIRAMRWEDVGGILHKGGTVIGTARCRDFTTRAGRLRAARNLFDRGIDSLVVIGGDGSLTGANVFRTEWPSLLDELVDAGHIDAAVARRHPALHVVGLVGSIDNDMFGTDMTIGADTALHRIVDAVDAIASTAASHHRTFVIEVMGRHCGYLALMCGLATGANWVLLPESPPDLEDWEGEMCRVLKAGRDAGRRHGFVIIAEGAHDRNGRPLTAQYIKDVIEHRMGSDTRLTILGHVQRGGAPSAFDRYQSTVLGRAAVDELLAMRPGDDAKLLGIREHRVAASPLMACVEKTREVAQAIAQRDYERAMELRGGSFAESWTTLRTLLRSKPHTSDGRAAGLRLAIMHCGGPAPGMNTAVRAATRLAMDAGHTVLGVRSGFRGLLDGAVVPLDWMSVHGWVGRGGAELGISRKIPQGPELERVAERVAEHRIDGILIIGGWAGYRAAYELSRGRGQHRALRLPIVCVPASINNNLPGSDHSIGADSALNSIVAATDKIKESAVASHRCFIVEVMGKDCGYLALMSGLASGAERVYMPEEGITLDEISADVRRLAQEFRDGKRLGLVIRSERADALYTTDFIARVFEKEGGQLFDVRQTILGHVQQGGKPSPFDRIQAIRLAARAVEYLAEQVAAGGQPVTAIGLRASRVTATDLAALPELVHPSLERPRHQPWLELRPIARAMAEPRSPAAGPDRS
jgi:6-phosphofructokinase 1